MREDAIQNDSDFIIYWTFECPELGQALWAQVW